jgi:hypothetical protein
MYNLATLRYPGHLKSQRVTLSCAMAPSSLSSLSSSSDEERILELRGLPEVILVGLATAMEQSGRKRRQRRHGGSRRARGQIATSVAKMLRTACMLTSSSRGTRLIRTEVQDLRLRLPNSSDVCALTRACTNESKQVSQRRTKNTLFSGQTQSGSSARPHIRSFVSPCASSGKVLALIQWWR